MSFFSKKPVPEHHPLVKTAASRKPEDNTGKVVYKILFMICLGLSAWTLNSSHILSVNLASERERITAEEKARIEQYQNLTQTIKTLKEDYEKKLADYKSDSDRRFSEIKKDLESINSKIDFLLTRKGQQTP